MTAHPSGAEAWEWDEGNEDELWQHRITPRDVYDVRASGPVWVPNKKHRAGDWKMIGWNRSGALLTIVIRYYSERSVIRPITGWSTTAGERAKYSRHLK